VLAAAANPGRPTAAGRLRPPAAGQNCWPLARPYHHRQSVEKKRSIKIRFAVVLLHFLRFLISRHIQIHKFLFQYTHELNIIILKSDFKGTYTRLVAG
jgi:hypothetical protein